MADRRHARHDRRTHGISTPDIAAPARAADARCRSGPRPRTAGSRRRPAARCAGAVSASGGRSAAPPAAAACAASRRGGAAGTRAMSIRVVPGLKREIAETLGQYFEARGMPFHIEERPAGVLHVGFEADGHPAAVTVTFDEDAFAAFEQWDIEQKRLALVRLAIEFAELMAQRSPTACAGDFHVKRF
ncbi:hypothetical protein [Burkholderia ubonensis]|uniref:hypothetical protein n=1 Tax=Burkholderia ubonensis TaxID=101571 RepID=UPI0039F536A9